MRQHTLWLILTALLLATGFGPAAHGQSQEREDAESRTEPSVWMKRKLEYSKGILAGLADGDYETIQENAEAMQSLSRFEAFVRGRSPEYRAQMQVFQDANREIIVQSKRRSVEGAALGFTQLTISCVNCHKSLRNPQASDAAEKKTE
jgi:hypothetical protein